jgi:NAD(P)-dependent dehydrogenase (short-subunit alcohol dehydrogenase family)
VAVSSLGSRRAVPAYGALGPTKAALEAIVRQCAFELAPRGVRVNAVNGGLIETGSIEKFPDAQKMKERSVQRTPAGRLGTPEEIAEIVLFLAGISSRWINGQTLVADGGFSIL